LKSSNVAIRWDQAMVCRGLGELEAGPVVAQSCGAKIVWYEWKKKVKQSPRPKLAHFFLLKRRRALLVTALFHKIRWPSQWITWLF